MRSRPIATLPTASQREFPVTFASVTPMSAKTRPTSAPESSRRTTGSSGFFVRRMKLHQVALFGFSRLASWRAVRNDSDSSTTETSRITIATPKYSSS